MTGSRISTLRDYQERVLRVLVYLQERLDQDLALEHLAGIACLSPCHFHRVFKGMIGESLDDYVRRLRLERAASRLKLDSASVLSIALDAGYSSHEAFTRAFRVAFGVPPSAYRKSKRRRRLPRSPSGVHYQPGTTPQNFEPVRKSLPMDVRLVQLKPLRVAFLRHVGPYSEVGATWDRLLTYLGKEGWLGGDLMCIGVCHDDPEVTPAPKIRYDACVTMGSRFLPVADIGVQTIAGGTYARATHYGPYNQLGTTYTRLLGEWLPRSGRVARDCPCFDVYLNDPQGTDPEDLLTGVYLPLK